MSEILSQLDAVIRARRGQSPESSYVASLFDKGLPAIQQKVGEEAFEAVIAANGADREALVGELADLWFHSLVMMAAKEVSSADVLAELERRFGLSGIEEKASRSP